MSDEREGGTVDGLQQVLTHDEHVAWSGRPDPVRCAKRTVAWFVAGLVFLGFAVLWIAAVGACSACSACRSPLSASG